MKKVKLFLVIALVMFYLMSLTSCFAPPRGFPGHGNPKGWNKNSNNPHHPNSSNPGKGHNKNK